jgi:hypothetical protein
MLTPLATALGYGVLALLGLAGGWVSYCVARRLLERGTASWGRGACQPDETVVMWVRRRWRGRRVKVPTEPAFYELEDDD